MCTKMKKISKIQIFKYFFFLGLLTIGGGYAMISLIEKELCKKKKWLTEEEFIEIIAVAQSLPGILATNVSTFVGQKIAGKSGAVVATIGVTLPSFLVIWGLYPILNKSFQSDTLNKVYLGVQAGVIMLILNSATNLFKFSIKSKFNKIIFLICFLTMVFFNISPIWIIIFGFASGYGAYLLERKAK